MDLRAMNQVSLLVRQSNIRNYKDDMPEEIYKRERIIMYVLTVRTPKE